MSDMMMIFPASVEEFMEQYKMTDTEHVYSNGTEYVPIYRMKQWFEHCRHQQIFTIDVAPVRHGRWVSVPHKLARVCSVCNRDEPYKFADIDADVYDYCPHCGAKLDGELDE